MINPRQLNRIAHRSAGAIGATAKNVGVLYDLTSGKALWRRHSEDNSNAELALIIGHADDHLSFVHHRTSGNDHAEGRELDDSALFAPVDLGLTTVRRGISLGGGITLYQRNASGTEVLLVDAAGTVKTVTPFHASTIDATCIHGGYLYCKTTGANWRRVEFTAATVETASISPIFVPFNSSQPGGNPPTGTLYHANGLCHAVFQHDGTNAYLCATAGATVTANATTDVINLTGNLLAVDDEVEFSTTGTLPNPLSPATTYYVVNPAANTFQVASSPGGAAINISSTGSGTHTVRPAAGVVGSAVYALAGTMATLSLADIVWAAAAPSGFTAIRLAQNDDFLFVLWANATTHEFIVAALDKSDGSTVWDETVADSTLTSVSSSYWKFTADADFVCLCADRIQVFAGDDGSPLWDKARNSLWNAPPALGGTDTKTARTYPVLLAGKLIFAGDAVQVFDAETGDILWTSGLQSFQDNDSVSAGGVGMLPTGQAVACLGAGELLGVGGSRELVATQREPNPRSHHVAACTSDGWIATGGSSLNTPTSTLDLFSASDGDDSYLWCYALLNTFSINAGSTLERAVFRLKLSQTPSVPFTVTAGIRDHANAVVPPDVATFLGYTWLELARLTLPVSPALVDFDVTSLVNSILSGVAPGSGIGSLLFRLKCSHATPSTVSFYANHASNDPLTGERWPLLFARWQRLK